MKKFRRKKLAFALACASILGGKTQAMDKNKHQSRQTLAAVATDKNSNKGFANWAKDHKWQLAVGIGVPVITTASILAFLGVKYWGKKDNGGDPSKDPNAQNFNKDNPQKNEQIEVDNKKQTSGNKPNEKRGEQIKNKDNNPDVIEIKKVILEEKVENLNLIKNKINNIKVEDKNQNDKDIIILAFEYFGGILAKNSLEKLNDLFDHITDYNKHKGANSTDINDEKNETYKIHVEESEGILLKIFGNNSEISNVLPEFEFREGYYSTLNIKFDFDGKNRRIALTNRDHENCVEFCYYYNCIDNGEAVVYKIPYDKILETAEN